MSHTVEIISVGTELLLGNIVNSDAQMLSRKLSELGLNVYYHTVVGDNPGRLKEAVETAKSRADILITTGGLGPTCDDLTKQTLAEAFGKKLILHQDIADELAGVVCPPGPGDDGKQSPTGSAARGVYHFPQRLRHRSRLCLSGPGQACIDAARPPSECTDMFEKQGHALPGRAGGGRDCLPHPENFRHGGVQIRVPAAGEDERHDQPHPGALRQGGGVRAAGDRQSGGQETGRSADRPGGGGAARLLGDVVYGVDVPNLETAVLELLKEKNMTLGTAESCTGGLIAKRLTDIPGSSQVFKGCGRQLLQ